ncbi:ATP-binding cassette domain-containing protein [Lysinibacillus mangiferihumi]|nr:ATP-binding cassette domain-containing protein [Lysinibacillus mangiferihumi]
MYSLRENIGFGNVGDMDNEQKIRDVIRQVGLGDKFSVHNVDLDTYLSKEMDGGIDLSGEEWQKIALGRALMKDVSLILLDEPTASLDPHSELKILEF